MKRFISLVLLSLPVLVNAGRGYAPISSGHWPFIRPGYSFNPSIKEDWQFATNDAPHGYSIYFYYTGKKNPQGAVEAGGVQMLSGTDRYLTADQLKLSLGKFESIDAGNEFEMTVNDVSASTRYGLLCLKFSRRYVSKVNSNMEGIADEGYYFVHPQQNRTIFKIHLFYRGAGGDTIKTLGAEMDEFFRLFALTSDFAPVWMFGAGESIDVGTTNGLGFGYYDSNTHEEITMDPGTAALFAVEASRKLKSPFYAGVRLSYAGYQDAILVDYQNLKGSVSRGFYGELNGGILLFSRFRHQLNISAGPVVYSTPRMKIEVTDSSSTSAEFFYTPAIGFAAHVTYNFVLTRNRGVFFWGLKYNHVSYTLDHFVVDGSSYDPSMLGTAITGFRKPSANNLGIVMIGYRYYLNR